MSFEVPLGKIIVRVIDTMPTTGTLWCSSIVIYLSLVKEWYKENKCCLLYDIKGGVDAVNHFTKDCVLAVNKNMWEVAVQSRRILLTMLIMEAISTCSISWPLQIAISIFLTFWFLDDSITTWADLLDLACSVLFSLFFRHSRV